MQVAFAVPAEPLVDLALYLDVEAPFRQDFRNADSTWWDVSNLRTRAE